MTLSVSAKIERWLVDGTFVISRGAKTHVDVIFCEISDGEFTGCSEATPIYYEGETAEACVKTIQDFARNHEQFDPQDLLRLLPAGAARNALDCALWDLSAEQTGKDLWELANLPQPVALRTAYTISLDGPDKMEVAAKKAAPNHSILKLKLAGHDDRERVAAVHRGAPEARLIVDANESWNDLNVVEEASALAGLGVELIEQPVSAGQDNLLEGVQSPIPLCVDESCHTSADIERIKPYYDVVNIKLDKTGGLTEAIRLADAAEAAGLKLMVGCMLSTSLAIRPAFALAQRATWVDLDGPLLLAKDRRDAFQFDDGKIMSPAQLSSG